MAASPSTPRRPLDPSTANPITPIPQRLPPGGTGAGPRRASSLTPDIQADGRRGSNTSASAAAAAEQRRARREQLRNFYGIKGEQGEGSKSGTVNGAGRGGDPLDIDSTGFSASAYYDNLISKESLSGLMKTASTLSADIGHLEGSKHSLVYNHHHQLFAAGDTISHLNSRTPQLLSIVTNLQQSFSSISGLVDSVALPEPSSATLVSNDDQSASVDMKVERLRLMVLAEESPDKVQAYYDTFQEDIEKLAEGGDAKAQKRLQECNTLLGQSSQES
nr:uncharacterized protein CI109_004992 [Kwoniella shandongensis]KAA5526602.1 hypothetical protein CI109_004992 [Kwoniella shandongensis]